MKSSERAVDYLIGVVCLLTVIAWVAFLAAIAWTVVKKAIVGG